MLAKHFKKAVTSVIRMLFFGSMILSESPGRGKGGWEDLRQAGFRQTKLNPKPLTLTANLQNRHLTDEKT